MLTKFFALMCRNPWLAAFGAVSMLDAVFVISGLAGRARWSDWLFHSVVVSGVSKKELTDLGIAHVVAWTILPPIWFFLETFTSAAHSTDAELKARYDRLRIAQDLGAKVWAAVLAAILFLVTK
jgi:hypothetical protein